MAQFKSNHYNIPDTIKPKQEKVKVEWLFDELTKDMIDQDEKGRYYVYPGCSCTAKANVSDTGIIAYYNDETTVSGSGAKTIDKHLKVYLKDGKEMFVKNNRGVKVKNDKKEYVKLTFSGIVKN